MPLEKPLRIASLIASSTELVCALGLEDRLVGRSHECDYPARVRELPQCTSPKFQTDGSSYEIDQRVKAIVQESLSVYRVDADILESLQPTHILTQAQCEVCAVSLRDVEEASCQLITSKPEIISLSPDCLEDLYKDIRMVADALAVEEAGSELIDSMRRRMTEVRRRAEEASRKIGEKRTVACIEWIEPLMAAGNWVPELIEASSAVNLFGEAGKHSPWMNWDDLRRSDPDVIIVTPCGFDNKRTLEEMHIISSSEGYAELKAVQRGAVYVADGNQYFNRPGPRLVESLEMLAEMIYPEELNIGHEGTGWLRYDQ